jgi:Deoxyribonuclease NucA/NucB
MALVMGVGIGALPAAGASAAPATTPAAVCGLTSEKLADLAEQGLKQYSCSYASPKGSVSTATLKPPRAVAPWPSNCSGKIGTYPYSRYGSCYVNYISVAVVQVPSGVVLGEGQLLFVSWAELHKTSQTWKFHVFVNLFEAHGVVRTDELIRVDARCSSACKISSDTGPELHQSLYPDVPLQGDWTVKLPKPAVKPVSVSQDVELTLNNRQAPGSSSVEYPGFTGFQRCETSKLFGKQKGGCVYTDYWPTFKLSTLDEKNGKSATFILQSQQNLADHWGANYKELTGPPLQRLTDKKKKAANRTASCKGFLKKNETDSCDEYPFASTYQGAALVGPERTAAGHVPEDQNKHAGALLSSFYAKNRMLDGDFFWVGIRDW